MAIDYEGHARNIKAFLDGIEGTHRFSLDGRAARKAVALVEAIYRSAETGRPVHLD
jgi:predicted dehydrogenase